MTPDRCASAQVARRAGVGRSVGFVLWSGLVALLLGLLALPARADEAQKTKEAASGMRHAGKELVEDSRSTGKGFGRDASEAAQEAWDKTKGESAAAADRVRHATREFWRDLIQEKERLLEKLRRENRELRARPAK